MFEKKIFYENELCEIKREKYYIFKTYYNFIHNKNCVNFLKEAYDFFSDFLINNKKKFNSVLEKEDVFLTVLIIALKSNLDNKNFINEDIETNSDYYVNYCSNNFKKYCIKKEIFIKELHIKQIFLTLFEVLFENNLIYKKKLSVKDKTIIDYKFIDLKYEKVEEEWLDLTFSEFQILTFQEELYAYTHHFSKYFVLCKKNFFSGKAFKPKNITYVLKKINKKIYIDEDYSEKIIVNIEKEKILDELKKLSNSLKLLYNDVNWSIETKKKIAFTQKKISEAADKYIIKIFLDKKIKNYIYFPLLFDFRGRKYYKSNIGPTQAKILRTLFYYGFYVKEDFDNVEPWENLKPYFELVKKIVLENKYEFKNCFFDIYFWCILKIGSNCIKKNKTFISVEEFLYEGENYLKNKEYYENDLLSINNIIENDSYVRIMSQLNTTNLLKNKIKKKVILKDATASVNQIFMKKLEPINEKSLNFLNLGNSNLWCDTYLLHRDMFIKENDHYETEMIKNCLSRKLIKKVIMIIPYSAGFKKCWENYTKKIYEDGVEIEVNSDLKKIIEKFYKFIKTEMQEKYFYKKNSSSYVNKMKEDFEENRKYEIITETGEADMSYYKLKKKSIEKKIIINGKKKRLTKLILAPTKALDIKSFETSSGPNLAHFLDADEIREIELDMEECFITIHDCFLVDVLNCTRLIKAKHKHYKKYIKNYDINTIFILL